MSNVPGEVRGKEALAAFYGALFQAIPDYRGDFDGRAITGDTAAVWGRFGGTLRGELNGIRTLTRPARRPGSSASPTRGGRPRPRSSRRSCTRTRATSIPSWKAPLDRDGLIEFFTATFAATPDLELAVTRWAAREDYVLVEWDATATIGGAAQVAGRGPVHPRRRPWHRGPCVLRQPHRARGDGERTTQVWSGRDRAAA